MFSLAIFAAILVSRWHLRDRFGDSVDRTAVYSIAMTAAVGGIVGARIFYVIGNIRIT